MKTAQELASELRELVDLHTQAYDVCELSAAMLRQQAEQIESLKADAERYQKLKNSCGFGIQKNGAIVLSICFYDKHPDHIGQLDAAIDAMKETS